MTWDTFQRVMYGEKALGRTESKLTLYDVDRAGLPLKLSGIRYKSDLYEMDNVGHAPFVNLYGMRLGYAESGAIPLELVYRAPLGNAFEDAFSSILTTPLTNVLNLVVKDLVEPLAEIFVSIISDTTFIGDTKAIKKPGESELDFQNRKKGIIGSLVSMLINSLVDSLSTLTPIAVETVIDLITSLTGALNKPATMAKVKGAINALGPQIIYVLDKLGPTYAKILPKMLMPVVNGFVQLLTDSAATVSKLGCCDEQTKLGIFGIDIGDWFNNVVNDVGEFLTTIPNLPGSPPPPPPPPPSPSPPPPSPPLAIPPSSSNAAGSISKLINSVLSMVMNAGSTIVKSTIGPPDQFGKSVASVVDFLVTASETALSSMAVFSPFLTQLKQFYTDSGADIMSQLVSGVVNTISSVISFIVVNPSIIQAITSLGTKAIAMLARLLSVIVRVLLNDGLTMINSIVISAVRGANTFVTDEILTRILEGLDNMTDEMMKGARSLSRIVMNQLQKLLSDGLSAMDSARDFILKAFQDMSIKALHTITQNVNKIGNTTAMITPMVSTIRRQALDKIQDVVVSITDKSTEYLSNLYDEINKNTDGFMSEISSTVSDLSPFAFIMNGIEFVRSNAVIFGIVVMIILAIFVMKFFNLL